MSGIRKVTMLAALALAMPAAATPPVGADAIPTAATPVPTPPIAGDPTVHDDALLRLLPADELRMSTDILVDGKGPFRFLVDTGSERTIVSRQLAERLDLPSSGRAVVQGVAGGRPVALTTALGFALTGRQPTPLRAPILERDDIGADGIIGLDLLAGRTVKFDFGRNALHIVDGFVRPPHLSGVSVRARERDGRLVLGKATIGSRRVAVIIDSGAQYSIANAALRKILSKRNASVSRDHGLIESVTGDDAVAEVATVGKIDMDGLVFNDIVLAFAEAPIFTELGYQDKPAMLLGMNALRMFDNVALDFEHGLVSFTFTQASLRAREFDPATRGGIVRLDPAGARMMRND